MSELYGNLYAYATLHDAWERVKKNDGCAGVDGEETEDFARALSDNLNDLHEALKFKRYSPAPLLEVRIPKQNGKLRHLAIPTVKDRIVQTACLFVIEPVLEAQFEAQSHAYRKHRGLYTAYTQIEHLRDRGYHYIVDADIDAFFDNVSHKLMLKKLADFIKDDDVLRLVKGWLNCDIQLGYLSKRPDKGLPQGSPIAPVLANLFLDELDESLQAQGFQMVRYADDFLVLCRSLETAEKALEAVDLILDKLQLELDEGKTELTSFHEGFDFLGASFIKNLVVTPMDKRKLRLLASQAKAGDETDAAMDTITDHLDRLAEVPWLPEPVAAPVGPNDLEDSSAHRGETDANVAQQSDDLAEPSEPQSFIYPQPFKQDALSLEQPFIENDFETETEPDDFLRPLYLMTQGSMCSKDGERFIVTKGEEKLLDIPIIKVEQVLVFGHAHLSTRVIQTCLARNIPITYLSSYGSYHGRLENPRQHNIFLQQTQFERLKDEAFKRNLVKNLISSKLHNSRALLLRMRRSQKQEHNAALNQTISTLLHYQSALNNAQTLDELRGFEGASARSYFTAYSDLIKEPFVFSGRSKNPPKDPINAILSFGYTLLFHNIYALSQTAGLNPYVGYLHALRQGHPALVSDLIEEFRAPIVDGLVLYLVNRPVFKPEDFSLPKGENQACEMSDEARKKFLHHFEQRIQSEVTHPATGYKVSWRRAIQLQIQLFAQVLKGEKENYQGMLIK